MKKSRIAVVATAMVAALSLLSPPAAAQEGTGQVSGLVTDPSGTALAGVTVSLSGADGAAWSRQTDAAGAYRFVQVSRGVYELALRHPQFAAESRSRVVVGAGVKRIENVTLRAASDYSVTMNIDSGTTSVMSSRATVSASTPEARPGDEAASEDTTVTSQADLAVVMSASEDPVVAGTELSYTITVTNAGPSVARYVEVTDTLPGGVTFVSTRGCAEDPAGLPVCTLGTIAPADSARYVVMVRVASSTVAPVVNQVGVSSQTVEIGPGDESASVETAVDTRADLVMTRSVAPDPVIAGTTLDYTVTVTNNGPSDAREVAVEDTLPAGVTRVATSGCAEDPAAVPTCTLGTIPAAGSRRYTVALVVDSAVTGVLTDEARLTSTTAEASPGNESTSLPVTVEARADLVMEVESPESVIAGTQMSYAVTVSNNGPSDARGVGITATLAPEATLAGTRGCEEDPLGTPTCSLGTIASGASRRVSAKVLVDSAALGGITTRLAAGSQTREARAGDESVARDTPVEARADLVMTSRDSVDPVIAGRPLTYTVEVVNNGPSDARDVVVSGELPAAVTLQATEGCAEDSASAGGAGSCSLGDIPANGSRSFDISVRVHADATGVITNRASVSSSTTEARPGDETVPPSAAAPEPTGGAVASVRRWAEAWSGKRVEQYLDSYSQRFQPPDGLSRSDWEALRRSRIESRASIDVRLSGFETESSGPDRAKVSFDQSYRSDLYSDRVRKTLELVREGERWLILTERSEG